MRFCSPNRQRDICATYTPGSIMSCCQSSKTVQILFFCFATRAGMSSSPQGRNKRTIIHSLVIDCTFSHYYVLYFIPLIHFLMNDSQQPIHTSILTTYATHSHIHSHHLCNQFTHLFSPLMYRKPYNHK